MACAGWHRLDGALPVQGLGDKRGAGAVWGDAERQSGLARSGETTCSLAGGSVASAVRAVAPPETRRRR